MPDNKFEILSTLLSKGGKTVFFFDVDETLKHRKGEYDPQRFNPNLPLVLFNLHQLGKVGIATDQSQSELQSFISKLNAYFDKSVTTGPYVLEGGHVITNSLSDQSSQIITSPQALAEIAQIFEIVKANYIFDAKSGWGNLLGVSTPVQIPDKSIEPLGTKSVWEKGPTIDDPSYQGEYDLVMKWLEKEAKLAGLLIHAALVEVGNGTLRIIERSLDKSTGLLLLHHQQLIDLSRVIYMGDGINDVSAAKVVKEYGGVVVAVSNAHQKLKDLADIIAIKPISDGVIEVFGQITQ